MLQQAIFSDISDYSPFGMVTPGRSFAAGEGYRFGFNGQEQVDEVYGNGNLNTAEFWEYDARIGRRWNIDPICYSEHSPYSTFNNNPIYYNDILGLKGEPSAKRQAKEFAKATGGRARKIENGSWEVDIKGTTYFNYNVWKSNQEENYIIDEYGVAYREYTVVNSNVLFKDGVDYTRRLENAGVEFWDLRMALSESFGQRISIWWSSTDSWVHSERGEEFGQQVANMNPGIAASNIVSGIQSGTDIYGGDMAGWDYVNNGLSLIPGEALVGQEVSVILRVGKFTGKILTAAQLAKRLGVTIEFYHKTIKPEMKRQFAKEAKELNTTNPDFTPDKSGNIVVINPVTKESIITNVPLDSFKEW